MPFAWSNFSKNTLRELARATGLKVTDAESALRTQYGEPPPDDFVDATWLVLRDGWVKRTPDAREEIVDRLRTARLGRAKVNVRSRAGQMEYLRTCRMSEKLRTIVHDVFCEMGGRSADASASHQAESPSEPPPQSVGALLRAGCERLDSRALALVEHTVCADIGTALADLPLPVSDEEVRDAAASVTTAALIALAKAGSTPMESDGDTPPHRRRVMTGAVRLSLDESTCESLVDQYFGEVAMLLASVKDLVNAQLTATSMFFTAIAHGSVTDVPQEDQIEMIGGLRWLLNGVSQTAEGAPNPDDVDITDTNDTAATHATLADFVGTIVTQHPGFVAAEETSDHGHAWLVAQGSVLSRVESVQDHQQPARVRFSVTLLRDVRSSPTLLETLNVFNARDWFFKAYAENDAIYLEYVQIAEELTEARLVYTLRCFIQTADELDSMLQDRFGGMTYAADVKAQFSV